MEELPGGLRSRVWSQVDLSELSGFPVWVREVHVILVRPL